MRLPNYKDVNWKSKKIRVVVLVNLQLAMFIFQYLSPSTGAQITNRLQPVGHLKRFRSLSWIHPRAPYDFSVDVSG